MKKKLTSLLSVIVLLLCVMPINIVSAFNPRYSAPDRSVYNANNPYSEGQCTWYAYARVREITGKTPPVWHGNANKWYQDTINRKLCGYGSTPKVGAIMVTQKTADSGHVAVVESITGNSMIISEYNWNIPKGFDTVSLLTSCTTRGSHKVLGYIYPDGIPEDSGGSKSPIANLDSISAGTGVVKLAGWAYDPDATSTSIPIHIYVGGSAGTAGAELHGIPTGMLRSDVNSQFGISGNHGFSATIPVKKSGVQQVYVYAIDANGNNNNFLGSFYLDIPVDKTVPKISNVKITNLSASGYDVTCDISDNIGVDYVMFPTRHSSGSEFDWIQGFVSNGKATARINTADFGSLRGTYVTHIYAYDYAGNYTLNGDAKSVAVPYDPVGVVDTISGGTGGIFVDGWAVDHDEPSKSLDIHVYIGDEVHGLTTNVYRSDVNSNRGVTGNHGFKQSILTNKTGNQKIKVYAINTGGGSNVLLKESTVNITKDSTPPVISNPTVTNVTSNGYTVTCDVSDNVQVTSVKFLTRHSSDLTAKQVNATISNGKASVSIKVSDHGNKYGNYSTEIYAYDYAGNSSSNKSLSAINVPSPATPTPTPTATPTAKPTATPTAIPTAKPTATPTVKPTSTLDPEYMGTITVESVTASTGDTVTVPVKISGNPGIAGYNFTIVYDKNVLTPISISKGSSFSSGSLNSNINQAIDAENLDSITAYWSNPSDVKNDGDMLILTFDVKDNAESGTYPINISYINGDVTNQKLEDITLQIINGAVTVSDVKKGDIFEDGAVNTKDGVLLSQYLAKWDVKFSDRQLKAADVYEDGAVNTKDGVKLSQVLAKWNGVTLTETKGEKNNLAVSVSSCNAVPGQYVDISVTAEENPGIAGFNFNIEYDKNVLVPVSITAGGILEQGDFISNINQGGDLSILDSITAYWSNPSDMTAIGELFTIRFKVSDDADGEIPVDLTYNDGDICNSSLESVECNITNGVVYVAQPEKNETVSVNIKSMDGEILDEIPDNDFIIETEIGNTASYYDNAYIITSLYTHDGRLLKVYGKKITNDLTDFTEEIIGYGGEIAEIRTFIWDSNMTPLEKSISIK